MADGTISYEPPIGESARSAVIAPIDDVPSWAHPETAGQGGVNLNHASGYQPGNGQPPDGPLSVVDAIKAAGPEGITDEELAKQGYAFISVMRAAKEGFVFDRGDRRYASIEYQR